MKIRSYFSYRKKIKHYITIIFVKITSILFLYTVNVEAEERISDFCFQDSIRNSIIESYDELVMKNVFNSSGIEKSTKIFLDNIIIKIIAKEEFHKINDDCKSVIKITNTIGDKSSKIEQIKYFEFFFIKRRNDEFILCINMNPLISLNPTHFSHGKITNWPSLVTKRSRLLGSSDQNNKELIRIYVPLCYNENGERSGYGKFYN